MRSLTVYDDVLYYNDDLLMSEKIKISDFNKNLLSSEQRKKIKRYIFRKRMNSKSLI